MTATVAIVALFAFIAGAISAVAGFGIGSILTPLLSLFIGVRLAVPAASIPHFFGNALRLFTLRQKIDLQVLKTFGLMSAAGGLAGALLHAIVATTALKLAFAVFLIGFGIIGLFRRTIRLRLGRAGAWGGGFISGLLGGLIGNQGGVRAAAMLGFGMRKDAFVATAVAIALLVDGARMPVYAFSNGRALVALWPLILSATVAVTLGTLAGKAILGRVEESVFRRIVAGLLVALGVAILVVG